MGRLTTHVLDTAQGRPAAALAIELSRFDGTSYVSIVRTATNADGRCDNALLEDAALTPGRYRLSFDAGAYFAAQGLALADPPFLDRIHVDFGVADPHAHYHVPLLVSPLSYSTYRGS